MSRRTRAATVAAVAGGFCVALIIAYLIVAFEDDDSTFGTLPPGNEEFEVLKPSAASPDSAAKPLSPTTQPAKSPADALSSSPAPSAAPPVANIGAPDTSEPGGRTATAPEPQPLRPPAQPFVK